MTWGVTEFSWKPANSNSDFVGFANMCACACRRVRSTSPSIFARSSVYRERSGANTRGGVAKRGSWSEYRRRCRMRIAVFAQKSRILKFLQVLFYSKVTTFTGGIPPTPQVTASPFLPRNGESKAGVFLAKCGGFRLLVKDTGRTKRAIRWKIVAKTLKKHPRSLNGLF